MNDLIPGSPSAGECRCSCHHSGGHMAHCAPCCSPCPRCGRNISNQAAHDAVCQPSRKDMTVGELRSALADGPGDIPCVVIMNVDGKGIVANGARPRMLRTSDPLLLVNFVALPESVVSLKAESAWCDTAHALEWHGRPVVERKKHGDEVVGYMAIPKFDARAAADDEAIRRSGNSSITVQYKKLEP